MLETVVCWYVPTTFVQLMSHIQTVPRLSTNRITILIHMFQYIQPKWSFLLNTRFIFPPLISDHSFFSICIPHSCQPTTKTQFRSTNILLFFLNITTSSDRPSLQFSSLCPSVAFQTPLLDMFLHLSTTLCRH